MATVAAAVASTSVAGVVAVAVAVAPGVQEVVAAAEKITGHSIPTRIAPRRAGDPATLVASSDRIRRELGWKPQYPDLQSIIDSAWRWHREHPHGYKD